MNRVITLCYVCCIVQCCKPSTIKSHVVTQHRHSVSKSLLRTSRCLLHQMRVLNARCKIGSSAFTTKRPSACIRPANGSICVKFKPSFAPTFFTAVGTRYSRCRAGSDDAIPNDDVAPQQMPGENSTVEEASKALQAFFTSLKNEEGLQEFMSWVPDAALDALIAVKKRIGGDIKNLTAHDLCELSLLQNKQGPDNSLQFFVDSYSHRVLLWDRLASVTPLSAMSLGPDKTCHRFLVKSSVGEELTLMVTLEKQESLTPQYRSAPRIERTWRLRSIVSDSDLWNDLQDCKPGPEVGPEVVVAAQVQALKDNDVAKVFQWASPGNQAATGPVDNFARMLQGPQFRPLLGHTRTETLRRSMFKKNAYFEIIAVHSSNTGMEGRSATFVYLWQVHRQDMSDVKAGDEDGIPENSLSQGKGTIDAGVAWRRGAWMTQAVQLMSATNTVYRPGADEGTSM